MCRLRRITLIVSQKIITVHPFHVKLQVEVVDPSTLVPLDFDTIMASVEKTGRVVVADECHQSCGVAAELVARIAESGFDKLKAPIRMVVRLDVPVPCSQLLDEAISPAEERIVDAIHATVD